VVIQHGESKKDYYPKITSHFINKQHICYVVPVMAKILHTADLHLREYGDERWKALQGLVETGKKEGIDLLVISGDLFDQDIDGENLRDKIRQVFTDTGFKVAIVPGNHDQDSYSRGMYFGEDAVIFSDFSSAPLECKDVLVWGFPFEPVEEVEVIHRLRSFVGKLPEDRCNVLLYHGELLDACFFRKDLGNEGDQRYMPVKLSYFKDLNFDYVLAGHFHSSFKVWKMENGGCFVYPGSAVSITRRETGRRKANLLETGKSPGKTPGRPLEKSSVESPREYELDTFHYEEVTVELDPFNSQDPLDLVQNRLQETHPQALVELKVTGFINGEAQGLCEKELVEKIKEAVRPFAEKVCFYPQFKDIRAVLEDGLAVRFFQKVEEEVKDEEMKSRIRDLALKALMEEKV